MKVEGAVADLGLASETEVQTKVSRRPGVLCGFPRDLICHPTMLLQSDRETLSHLQNAIANLHLRMLTAEKYHNLT